MLVRQPHRRVGKCKSASLSVRVPLTMCSPCAHSMRTPGLLSLLTGSVVVFSILIAGYFFLPLLLLLAPVLVLRMIDKKRESARRAELRSMLLQVPTYARLLERYPGCKLVLP